ncbi:hypothetical protein PTKIN_Ptkin01aG0347300 [Pterospermum kingtungense]
MKMTTMIVAGAKRVYWILMFATAVYTMISSFTRHPLILMKWVKEDDSGEYYCDVCENERNPEHPVYWCEKCTYIVHLECIVHEDNMTSSKEVPSSVPHSVDGKVSMIGTEMEHNQGTDDIHTSQQLLIRPLIHEHPMKFYEVTEENQYCNGCRLVLNGPSYICTECPYQRVPAYLKNYYLHEKCTNLPYEIQHPLHFTHPLYLYTEGRPDIRRLYVICDECRDICCGFIYLCEECDFKLDVKCAFTSVSQLKLQMERATELNHFNHPHKLILVYSTDPIVKRKCLICQLPILSPAYFCPTCYNYICHESCLGLPQKMQVPFHPEHQFVLSLTSFSPTNIGPPCCACRLTFGISPTSIYSCDECDVKLHCICANSLRWPLKYESHEHELYYFGTHCQLLFATYARLFSCSKCLKSCRGQPFYRCLQCDINFHLECVPIPHIVKSRYHLHPLKLKDSFTEDDSGEYYCDICEEERCGEDHVYCCEKCDDKFVAHMECVLAKVEEVISYMVPHESEDSKIHEIVHPPPESDYSGDDHSPVQGKEEEDSTAQDKLEEV